MISFQPTRSANRSATRSPKIEKQAWRKRKRFADPRWVFASFLVTGLLLSFMVSEYVERNGQYRDPEFHFLIRKVEKLRSERPQTAPLIVGLGSSRVFMALNGKVAEDRLQELGHPATVFNFGFHATGPGLQTIYLERIRKAKLKPNTLVLEFLPILLVGHDNQYLEEAAFSDSRFDREEMKRAAERRLIRRAIMSWTDLPCMEFFAFRWELFRDRFPNWVTPEQRKAAYHRQESGWEPWSDAHTSPEDRERAWHTAETNYRENLSTGRIRPEQRENLIRLIRLAKQTAPNVVLLWMPEGPKFQAMYSPEVLRELQALIVELKQTEGISLIDARNGFHEEDFIDSHHMLREPSTRFSTQLADRLMELGLVSSNR